MRNNNVEIFRKVVEEGFNKGNLEALDDCYAPGFVEHQFDMPANLEGLKDSIKYLRETFAPFSLRIDDVVEDGDKVWVRMTGSGTDSKGMMGKPASNKAFLITVFDMCRFKNGKIVEHWGVPDRFHQMVQLGLIQH